jgi:fructuronate reductase
MQRLSRQNLPNQNDLHLISPAAKATNRRIVHIGLGQFAKGHLAHYTQLANEVADGWQVTAVNLNSPRAKTQLQPQDNLYTVTAHSSQQTSVSLISVLDQVLFAQAENAALRAVLLSSATRIISLTITEKGYCQTATGNLDLQHPGIQHDLAALDAPETAIGWIVWTLQQRYAQNLPPVTILALDNLNQNGQTLRKIVTAFAAQIDPVLADYIAAEIGFPCSMVDRIVPAVTAQDVDLVAGSLGVRDEACVVTEQFSQWVLEDQFVNERPVWDQVGVTIVDEVAPFEKMKLRLLNGAHSALAYIGPLAGLRTVADCMAEPEVRGFIEGLMTEEVLPQVVVPPGVELRAYIASLLERFANSHLQHRCEQIAMDGSQKIPQRWLPVFVERLAENKPVRRLQFVVAAWLAYVRKARVLEDPLGKQLTELLQNRTPHEAVTTLVQSRLVLPADFASLVPGLAEDLEDIETRGVRQGLRHLLRD